MALYTAAPCALLTDSSSWNWNDTLWEFQKRENKKQNNLPTNFLRNKKYESKAIFTFNKVQMSMVMCCCSVLCNSIIRKILENYLILGFHTCPGNLHICVFGKKLKILVLNKSKLFNEKFITVIQLPDKVSA